MAKKEARGRDPIDLLLENNIALQKTLTNLAIELKALNTKVSTLLTLFEEASKSFKEGKVKPQATIPTEIIEKIDELAKQNKTIARGLLLLEKTVRESKTEKSPAESYKPKPLPEYSF